MEFLEKAAKEREATKSQLSAVSNDAQVVDLPKFDDEYIDSLVVRNFDRRISSRKLRDKEQPDEDDVLIHGTVRKEACFELPIEVTEEGFQLSKEAEVVMMTTMAPSRVDGKWSGTLEGRSTLESTSTATGAVTLDYKSSRSTRLSFGMIRGHEIFYPLITIGGTIVRKGSSVGVTFYHNASFLHAMLFEHSMYSLSFRHLFPNTRWLLTSELSRRQKLSLSLSNTKLAGIIGWNLRNPKEVEIRVDARPKISDHRRAHLFYQWKAASWQVGISLLQTLGSQIASVGLGLRIRSSRGIEWLFSWNRGDASVKIPIIVSRSLTNVSWAHALYFSMLSFLIQEGIADMWGWNAVQKDEEEVYGASEAVEGRAKAREDAEIQRELMARQAKRKKRDEAAKEGLVIHKATYHVEDGDEWDATIPLQFWVNHSSVALPPTSKSKLLGFYDVTVLPITKKEEKKRSDSVSRWQYIWNDLLDLTTETESKKKSNKGPSPTLTVRYDFKGQPYRITVKDSEELKIPSPHAIKL